MAGRPGVQGGAKGAPPREQQTGSGLETERASRASKEKGLAPASQFAVTVHRAQLRTPALPNRSHTGAHIIIPV